MFTINGTEYRSLIEQVKQNGQDILNIKNGGLTSTAGLVIEQSVQTVEDLPVGKFGIGVLVGTSADNQHLYAFLSTASVLAGEWVDLGQYPAPGIQGEQGIQGIQGLPGEQGVAGQRGNFIYNQEREPSEKLENGDIWIQTNGDLYTYINNNWQYLTNIQGLQGIQGTPGTPGNTPYIQNGTWWIGETDTGVEAKGQSGIAVILQSGIYTTDTLPNFASTQNLDGFIVKTANGYDLYIHAMNGTEYTIIENWAGVKGEQGIQGIQGVGVQSIIATKSSEDSAVVNYDLTTTLTNGNTQSSGILSIPRGLNGLPGPVGPQGIPGVNGKSLWGKNIQQIISNQISTGQNNFAFTANNDGILYVEFRTTNNSQNHWFRIWGHPFNDNRFTSVSNGTVSASTTVSANLPVYKGVVYNVSCNQMQIENWQGIYCFYIVYE